MAGFQRWRPETEKHTCHNSGPQYHDAATDTVYLCSPAVMDSNDCRFSTGMLPDWEPVEHHDHTHMLLLAAAPVRPLTIGTMPRWYGTS